MGVPPALPRGLRRKGIVRPLGRGGGKWEVGRKVKVASSGGWVIAGSFRSGVPAAGPRGFCRKGRS